MELKSRPAKGSWLLLTRKRERRAAKPGPTLLSVLAARVNEKEVCQRKHLAAIFWSCALEGRAQKRSADGSRSRVSRPARMYNDCQATSTIGGISQMAAPT